MRETFSTSGGNAHWCILRCRGGVTPKKIRKIIDYLVQLVDILPAILNNFPHKRGLRSYSQYHKYKVSQ